MPCHAAMMNKVTTLAPDTSVEDALKILDKHKIDTLPVVEEDGLFLGLFGRRILMKNLLPVSVAMSDGIQLDVKIPAAPGIARRLKKVMPLPIHEFADRKVPYVHPEMALWQCVSLIVQYGAPLPVLETETKKFIGLISDESALSELIRLKSSED
jgi:CBS domain-containing protein